MDQIYTKNGGEFLNAFTSEDQTVYFVRIPKNKLELWAWLESDRLANPVFREFYSERDVVFEERRLRTESTPLGKFDEAVQRDVLGGASLPLAGGGLGLGHPDVHARPGQASTSPPTTPPTTSPASSSATSRRRRSSRSSSATSAASRAARRAPAGGDPRAEAARREALLRRGRDLAHRPGLVEGGAVRAQGLRRPRPAVRRPLRPHRAALQGRSSSASKIANEASASSTRASTAGSSRSRPRSRTARSRPPSRRPSTRRSRSCRTSRSRPRSFRR